VLIPAHASALVSVRSHQHPLIELHSVGRVRVDHDVAHAAAWRHADQVEHTGVVDGDHVRRHGGSVVRVRHAFKHNDLSAGVEAVGVGLEPLRAGTLQTPVVGCKDVTQGYGLVLGRRSGFRSTRSQRHEAQDREHPRECREQVGRHATSDVEWLCYVN
jgi:hypothetical protein